MLNNFSITKIEFDWLLQDIVGIAPQLALDFGGVNSVASVVSRSVSDKLDEVPAGSLAGPIQPAIK